MSHINDCHATYERVVSRMTEPCSKCQWVMSHTHKTTRSLAALPAYKWVMPNTNKSCHIQMRHVTHRWVTEHVCIYIYKHIYIHRYIYSFKSIGSAQEACTCNRQTAQSCHLQPSVWMQYNQMTQAPRNLELLYTFPWRAAPAHSLTFAPIHNFPRMHRERNDLYAWGIIVYGLGASSSKSKGLRARYRISTFRGACGIRLPWHS